MPIWRQAPGGYGQTTAKAELRDKNTEQAVELATKHPKLAFANGKPEKWEYDRIMAGLGFPEAPGEMTDETCVVCKNPGEPRRVVYYSSAADHAARGIPGGWWKE